MDILFILIVLFGGLFYANNLSQKEGRSIYLNVYLYHFLFTCVFFWFVSNRSADANSYFNRAFHSETLTVPFKTGTGFMDYINTPIVHFFSLGKFSLFALYGLISYYGFVYYYKLISLNELRLKSILNIPIRYVLFFLPGMHFWTAGLGKDCLMFTSVIIVIHAIVTNPLKHKMHIVIGLVLIICIRPHILVLFLCSMSFVYALNSVTTFNFKSVVVLAVLIGGLIFVFPLFSDFVGLSEASVEGVENQFDRFNRYGKKGIEFSSSGAGSSIDVSSYPLPYKIFSFLFRPLFYDARSAIQLIASIENFILLALVINWFRNVKLVSYYRGLSKVNKGILWYVVLGSFVFGMTLYNLGLASRQKFMIIPELMFLLVILSKNNANQKN